MGKILQTVNLIVNAIKPKQVTWSLNRDGTYNTEEKEIENRYEIELENPTTKELEIPFEAHFTDSGIPWCEPKKQEKLQTNIIGLANPKLSMQESEDQEIDDLKTFREMQETLVSKLKIEKIIEKKCKTYISSLKNSRFTREELAREKKADSEMRRRLQILLKELKPKKKN